MVVIDGRLIVGIFQELEQLVQEDEESDEVESTDEREKREGEEAIRELERLAFSEEGPDKRQIQIMKELERQEREREKEKDNSERKSRSKKGLPSSMCNPPMSVEKSPSLTKEESRNGRMTSGSNGKKKRITDKSKRYASSLFLFMHLLALIIFFISAAARWKRIRSATQHQAPKRTTCSL